MSDEIKEANVTTVDDMRQNNLNKSKKPKKPQHKPEPEVDFKFDKLKMFFGEPLKLNDYIVIKQPTIGEILDAGEKHVFSTVVAFTGNTTLYRLQLWDIGIDWNKITNWELFCMLITSLPIEDTQIFFGNLDFRKFQIYTKKGTEPYPEDAEFDANGEKLLAWEKKPEQVLYDAENDYIIDELLYLQIREYMRLVFDQHPKEEFARGKYTKETMIQGERNKIRYEELRRKKEGTEDYGDSYLLPLISTLSNSAGFKYDLDGLRKLHVMSFMDSVRRFQILESTSALNRGLYSGFLDASKIDKNQFNYFR